MWIINLSISLYVLFVFSHGVFFDWKLISPPLCLVLSLSATAAGSFYLGRLMFLTVPSIFGMQPRLHWLDLISTKCSLPLSFCSLYYLANQHVAPFPESCNSAHCRPRCRHCFHVMKYWPETHPISALLCMFKWCCHCVGFHRLFWLSGLLSASLCGNLLAVNDESKDE